MKETNLPHLAPGEEMVESVFRIGQPDHSQEVIIEGVRYLRWIPNDEEHLAPYAGWAHLHNGVGEDGIAFLEVPAGTRSAGTILAGSEAWEGEKSEIIDFLTNYTASTFQDFGGIDSSLSMDTLAVTKERRMFATPPHALITDRQEITTWLNSLLLDLQNVLVNEPNRKRLLVRTIAGMQTMREIADDHS